MSGKHSIPSPSGHLEGLATDRNSIVVRVGAGTHVGKRRTKNEDSYGARFPMYLVADGMGGHEGGAAASEIGVTELLRANPAEQLASMKGITEGVRVASEHIDELNMGGRAPGTTLTGIALGEHRGYPCVHAFNIGDSRTYLCSEGKLTQITKDHSEVQELLDSGEITVDQALTHSRKNVITKALGAGSLERAVADLYFLPAHPGDRYLICSDGLTNEVPDAILEEVCLIVADPQQAADELVTLALKAGGRDNVTLIVVDVVEVTPEWEDVSSDDRTLDRNGVVDGDTIPRSRRFSLAD